MTVDSKTTRGTPIVWTDSAGTHAMTLKGVAAGAGWVGAQKDLGAGATDEIFEVRVTAQWDVQPVAGETLRVYVSTTDDNEEDGQAGTTNQALDAESSLQNMNFVGALVVTTATVDHDFTASFITRITTRYFSPVVFNDSGEALQDGGGDVCSVTFTPIIPQAADAV